jgi:hypothetical protein
MIDKNDIFRFQEWHWRRVWILLHLTLSMGYTLKTSRPVSKLLKGRWLIIETPETRTDHHARLAWRISFHKPLVAKIHRFLLDRPTSYMKGEDENLSYYILVGIRTNNKLDSTWQYFPRTFRFQTVHIQLNLYPSRNTRHSQGIWIIQSNTSKLSP